MKKQRKKKVRKLDSYAMGSGNTGVVKGYMPDPNEVFRQDEINVAKAQYEGATNPFVQGLDILGGLVASYGPDIAMKAKQDKVDDMADTATDVIKGMDTVGLFAMGTGPMGTPSKVNVEDGEVLETPEGKKGEVKGKKHSQGGEDMIVPEGTRIFSDQLEIDGVSMADRKKARDKRLRKAQRAVDNDGTDMIAKETFTRTKEAYDIEEENDLMLQGFARGLDEMYNYAMGTDPAGTYNLGTDILGVGKDMIENPGNLLSIFGNIYSGVAPLKLAKQAAADDTVNPNYYEGFGQDALASIEQAGSVLEGQQDLAKKSLESSRQGAISRARKSTRGINQARALELGIDANTNKAMTDLYMNFSDKMMQNLYQKAGLQTQIDQAVMTGEKEADIANRMDKDAAMTNLGIAQSNLGTAIQTTGKDLNQAKRSTILTNLAKSLSKYGLQVDAQGNIINPSK